MTETSIARLYADDHTRLDGLFRQCRSLMATDPIGARECFRQFKEGLERHIVWEEDLLFPVFEATTGMRESGPTAVMRYEHLQIRQLLDLIDSTLAEGHSSAEDESRLIAIIDAHNWKEETLLYPMIDQEITAEERRQVLLKMSARHPSDDTA